MTRSICSICVGRPEFEDAEIKHIAATAGVAAAWVQAFSRFGAQAPAKVSGDFAVAVSDPEGRILLAVDRFSIRTLCYRLEGGTLTFAERADDLAGAGTALDPQALFDYLYFHVIPAPRTVFSGVQRLPAGHYALFENGTLTVKPWWTPHFEEERHEPLAKLKVEFRELLKQCVTDQLVGDSVGCFLSGGTDSSTVVGMLREVTGEVPKAFSIGFDAAGYDEMEYARIAARRFGAQHHEYYVTADDLVRSIPHVATHFDQPFGNSSVLPAYYCAKMAREAGVERLLAGDGGDELFGGNTRYARQRVFGVYGFMPGAIRRALLEPTLAHNPVFARVPLLKKAVSYVEQARVPMPDRMQMYNLLMRIGLREVLAPDFVAAIDADEPLHQQRNVYDNSNAKALINRMIAYDWKYTLADNDLPKVVGATSLAGIHAGFPLLDNRLVDFSLRLAPELKLNGLKLRWFFKEAMRDFLPEEIITKKKHGFGLPFGVWTAAHVPLKRLALDCLDSLRLRGVVRSDFIDTLMDKHLATHPGYYGEMIWILIVLEQWLQAKAPDFRVV